MATIQDHILRHYGTKMTSLLFPLYNYMLSSKDENLEMFQINIIRQKAAYGAIHRFLSQLFICSVIATDTVHNLTIHAVLLLQVRCATLLYMFILFSITEMRICILFQTKSGATIINSTLVLL